jgi:hypothetical protein
VAPESTDPILPLLEALGKNLITGTLYDHVLLLGFYVSKYVFLFGPVYPEARRPPFFPYKGPKSTSKLLLTHSPCPPTPIFQALLKIIFDNFSSLRFSSKYRYVSELN